MAYEPTETDRGALMRALAAAEQVAARVPHLPHDLKLTWDCRGTYSLDLYFHHGPANVCSFAHEFGAQVVAHPHGGNVEKTFTETHAIVDGIAVRAWSLDETAVLEGLLAEQHHQVEDPDEPPAYAATLVPTQMAPVEAVAATKAVPA